VDRKEINDLCSTTTKCQQRQLFWGSNRGRCTQVLQKKSLFMLNKIHNNFLVINAAPLEWFSTIQSWTRQHLPATQQGHGAI